jgi:riboflavin synthase
MKETIDRTALSIWRVGSLVNLERALSTGQRNGGHHVSGHIDTVGNILEKNEEGIATRLIISLSPSYTKYLIEKGSIALDGISLTLTKVWDDRFEVSLIPHTKLATTIYKKKVGDPINIEVDMMAKFIEKLMAK